MNVRLDLDRPRHRPGHDFHLPAYVVRGEIETSFVTSGFTAAQFGNTTSKFSTGPEFLTRAAVVIDFTPIIWR